MADSEIYDDIDEYAYPKDIAEDEVSKYCIAIYNAATNTFIGTGVLIADDGLFISAGHNFKNSIDDIKVFYNDKQYDIEKIYREYDEDFHDLAIGNLSNFQDGTGFKYPVLTSCEDLKVGSEVSFAGFKSCSLYGSRIELLGVACITSENEIYKMRITKDLPEPDSVQKILLQKAENRIMMFLPSEKAERYKGFSGGPIYAGNKVYGIIISTYFLKSDYIKEQLGNTCKNNYIQCN